MAQQRWTENRAMPLPQTHDSELCWLKTEVCRELKEERENKEEIIKEKMSTYERDLIFLITFFPPSGTSGFFFIPTGWNEILVGIET